MGNIIEPCRPCNAQPLWNAACPSTSTVTQQLWLSALSSPSSYLSPTHLSSIEAAENYEEAVTWAPDLDDGVFPSTWPLAAAPRTETDFPETCRRTRRAAILMHPEAMKAGGFAEPA